MIVNKPYALSEIKKLTPTVTSFVFAAQDEGSIDFVPGMFAMLQYRNDSTGYSIARAFSIANPPPSDKLEFIIAMIHGELTSKLEEAKVGDIYHISAPYGQFKFDINANQKFLFLAGGTGLAPFLSMLRYAKQLGAKTDCTIIYSVKYPDEIIDQSELDEMEKNGLKVVVTVTRSKAGDGWNGETGHVNADMITKYAPDLKDRDSYICGPPAFVKALKDCLISLGVDSKKIRAEMWGE